MIKLNKTYTFDKMYAKRLIMETIYSKKELRIDNVKTFDLEQTLLCGQCFRWKKVDNVFIGIINKRVIKARQEKNTLFISNILKKDINDILLYFDLFTDYGEIKRNLEKIHPVLKEAATYAKGIHILNQDPFETLISFIISQNNNIPRIEKIVESLCENFGEEIEDGYYSFPSASVLASLSCEELNVIKAGFRNRYIIDAAQKVNSGQIDFENLRTLDYIKAREKLKEIVGVGDKVADCVLLYGLHRMEGFPMDVWMKRAMEKLFDNMEPEKFGKYAGVAQQYIFHYSRMHKEIFT